MLGLAGGVLGLAVAYGALKLLVAIGPETLPRLREITIDPTVLGFTLVASLLSGLLFGVIPVLKYSGPRIIGALRSATRTSSHSRERHRARNLLVVVQVALALVLLVASGLMIRTFQILRNVQPGFVRPGEVQMLRVSIPDPVEGDAVRVARIYNDILDKVAALPGVESAALVSSAPLERFDSNDPVSAEDKVYSATEIPPIRRFKFVSPGYFRTVGTPLIVGRDISWTDVFDDRRVTMISENMARELWGGAQAALGKRIRAGNIDDWREIVGVVGDVHDNGVQEPAPTIVYWPIMMPKFWGNERFVSRGLTYVVRSDRTNTEAFLTQIREAVWSVNASLPLALVRTLQDVYERSMARTTFALVMLAIAGVDGVAAGPHRHLRRHLVLRLSANARDRNSHGARRRSRGCPPHVRPSRPRAVRHRYRDRNRGGRGPGEVDGVAALQRQPARRRDLCGGIGRPGVCGRAGQLSAGAPCSRTQSCAGAAC